MRQLARTDIPDIWHIDRSELVEAVYLIVDGRLVLKPERHEPHGWPAGVPEQATAALESCLDRGGWLGGLYHGDVLVGVVALDSRFIGQTGDMLQMSFLHVGRPYRDRGLGRQLFLAAAEQARSRGARRMYVSATPSEHTVNFYLGLGCVVAAAPNPDLFDLEPEDIHLEYAL